MVMSLKTIVLTVTLAAFLAVHLATIVKLKASLGPAPAAFIHGTD